MMRSLEEEAGFPLLLRGNRGVTFTPDGERLAPLFRALSRAADKLEQEMALTRGLGPHVMVTGHPYVDIWEAVKPASVGIRAWPKVPMGQDWKTGVCRQLGWGTPQDGWRKVYGSVKNFRDLDATLIGAVERLIDFVTVDEPLG